MSERANDVLGDRTCRQPTQIGEQRLRATEIDRRTEIVAAAVVNSHAFVDRLPTGMLLTVPQVVECV